LPRLEGRGVINNGKHCGFLSTVEKGSVTLPSGGERGMVKCGRVEGVFNGQRDLAGMIGKGGARGLKGLYQEESEGLASVKGKV